MKNSKREKALKFFFLVSGIHNILSGIIAIKFPWLVRIGLEEPCLSEFRVFLFSGIIIIGLGTLLLSYDLEHNYGVALIGFLAKLMGIVLTLFFWWFKKSPEIVLLNSFLNDFLWLPGYFYYLIKYRYVFFD